jgi:uncharacterized coiled-coil protein SlyX
MKYFLGITLLLACIHSFGQNKKELDQRIDQAEIKTTQLESRLTTLESELSGIKITLSATNTTILMLVKANADMEKELDSLRSGYSALKIRYDSLLLKNSKEFTRGNESKEELEPPLVTTGDSVRYLIKSFIKCKTTEERNKYIFNPDKWGLEMSKTYSAFGSGYYRYTHIKFIDSSFKMGVLTSVPLFYEDKLTSTFYCIRTKEGIKIVWSPTIGYNKVPLKAFFPNLELDEG